MNTQVLEQFKREKIREHLYNVSLAMSRLFDAQYSLEELTQKDIDINMPLIQNLASELEEGSDVHAISEEALDAFLNDIKDRPSPFSCADGSCHVPHLAHVPVEGAETDVNMAEGLRRVDEVAAQ